MHDFYEVTPSSSNATVWINEVELYKGYFAYDNFSTCAVGNTPPLWTLDNTGGTVSILQASVILY
ncbi:MAG: hypothetical protein Q7J78_05270 [Clostridiales bacterium]|nr:hypothetical protein [Clostridiales bacterium]